MRIACCLLASGCAAGIGPVIGVGVQGTEHGASTLGLQLGGEASFGMPLVEATAGAYWIQSHGLAYGGHFDLGWDGAWNGGREQDGRTSYGGRVGIGGIKLDDDVVGQPFVMVEANASRLISQCSGAFSSHALSLSLRFNPRGFSVVLAPRLVASDCASFTD